ncbi:hypothetical protein SLA2020_412850 [Shorea laevis]
MGLVSFPSSLYYSVTPSNSLPIFSQTRNFPRNGIKSACFPGKLHKSSMPGRWGSRQAGSSLVPFDAKSSGSREEDHRALETVLKLYSAIKNQNVRQLSDIIADECVCMCSFISFFQPFHGKKQVLEFFSSLIAYLGNHIEFVVKPTLHDGMQVGVQWSLDWKTTHVPLGKGFSFHICHAYKGNVMIRNVEIFLEPLLHIDPIRLKILGFLVATMDKITSITTSQGNTKRVVYVILGVVFMSIILFFSKPGLY